MRQPLHPSWTAPSTWLRIFTRQRDLKELIIEKNLQLWYIRLRLCLSISLRFLSSEKNKVCLGNSKKHSSWVPFSVGAMGFHLRNSLSRVCPRLIRISERKLNSRSEKLKTSRTIERVYNNRWLKKSVLLSKPSWKTSRTNSKNHNLTLYIEFHYQFQK